MFPESDPGPYLIVETHDSVRHCCSWPHTLAAPPLLTTDFAMSSSWGSFHSVSSDLSEEWEYIRWCDYGLLESCLHIAPNVSLQSKPKPGTHRRHSLSINHPDPLMSLETLLTKMKRNRRMTRSER
jgi:hypothetical protein